MEKPTLRLSVLYKHTGVEDTLETTLLPLINSIKERIKSLVEIGQLDKGSKLFCSFNHEDIFRIIKNKYGEEGIELIYNVTSELVLEGDLVVLFVNHEEQSGGMEAEFERLKEEGKTFILLIKEGLDFNHFREASSLVVEYRDIHDLLTKVNSSFDQLETVSLTNPV